jgi:cell wall-associated NlpC family hydrolase
MPVRLIAGALASLAIVQVSLVAARSSARPPVRAAAARPAAAEAPLPAPRMRLRLETFEPGVTFRSRSVIAPLRLPGVPRAVSLRGVPPRVRAALRAAVTALGVDYRWAGATPNGFDCSGLTMWAWAHAGVRLPHNSAAQRASLPAVSRGSLRPGDLLFFYSPVSHVAMYVGRGLMIDAVTSRDQVVLQPVWWDSYVGAARPRL